MNSARHGGYFGTTTNPCPWWCDGSAGRGYDGSDGNGQPPRLHSYEVGHVTGHDRAEVRVVVEALETLVLDTDGTHVSSGPLLCSSPDAEILDPAMARHLAYLLTQAAEFIDDVSE